MTLANTINREHRAGERALRHSLEHFRKCGDTLLAAKKKYGQHGKWLKWVMANICFTHRRANEYMRLARNWDKLAPTANLTLTEALAQISKVVAEPQQRKRKTKDRDKEAAAKPPAAEVRWAVTKEEERRFNLLVAKAMEVLKTKDVKTTVVKALERCVKERRHAA